MSALLTRDIRSPANSMPTSHWSASDFAGAVAVASVCLLLCASRRTRPVSSRRIESNSTQSPFTVDAKQRGIS
ncbi:hypothetical protein HYE67_009413 [Fusarium culmorum]|uniref:Uncharacterized protein n=1 Tax=Fusarium culmorum TaxID=5516 RepID=A0A2T4HBU7_FUSCU|nr:hypothetical protein FCULG_00004145 [Fusarium culmorum]QPC67182.1 hypothetical protein HYE67_009413 [Fusarium culmorum]